MASTGTGDALSFARDIRPLFREKDRDSMMRAFDLFDYADVVEHATPSSACCAAARCRATERGPPPR
ncbi:MAG: hypothetical protein WAK83_17905 [Trebonia sp.]